ncbi:hypothetical protein B0J12DRAFT_586895 [Macrophomina phaseolina]|uniref:FAD/NAD(P)-binding domain-containing protein n=1 Tax=Macrophomina phaseolina TaxID=35725 RepID=A0ABQ8FQL2_9PEZI|nr:hypothetical protein B0J12DRAFT_586895 [Macrophomina phaseolina]
MVSLGQLCLILKILAHSLHALTAALRRSIRAKLHSRIACRTPATTPTPQDRRKTVLIVGASFAGYHAARLLAAALPPATHHVVIVEPRSHFHYTWGLPRYSVVPGHEEQAFIPYGGYLGAPSRRAFTWVRDKVVRLEKEGVARLRGGGEVRWDWVIVATGGPGMGRVVVGAEGKTEGVQALRACQEGVRGAQKVVVVGGGAVGVEVAADVKSQYPEKKVTLVHSRGEVMGRFGEGLREVARKGLEELGVEVVLGERVVEKGKGGVVLSSGTRIDCDFLIDSTGQKPASGIIADLSPSSIAESGYIQVKPTMQIADGCLPNVYIAGDVAKTDARNGNARSAMEQATVAADNILLAIRGQKPRFHYQSSWVDASILLTLGLKKDVMYISDGEAELLFNLKSKGPSMNAAAAWRLMGAKPFVDNESVEERLVKCP